MNQKQLGEEKLNVILEVTVHHCGKPRQGFKAGAWSRNPRTALLLDSCPSTFLPHVCMSTHPEMLQFTVGQALLH